MKKRWPLPLSRCPCARSCSVENFDLPAVDPFTDLRHCQNKASRRSPLTAAQVAGVQIRYGGPFSSGDLRRRLGLLPPKSNHRLYKSRNMQVANWL